jgi:glycosyltransferase involved in cell wall biosynthesis
MNVLILTTHFNAGGISSYVLNLARGLKARGHMTMVVSSGGDWVGRLEEDNISHIYLPLRTKSIISLKLLPAYFLLKKIIKDKKIELIHAQTRVTCLLASRLSRKTPIPFISTAHGFYRRRWGRFIFPGWGRFVIAISEQVKQHLISDFGLEQERIRLVHNGIDATQYTIRNTQYNKDEARERFGLKDGPVAGIIARLSEVKGQKYLIMALAKVKEEIPAIQLLCIGDGKTKKDLEDLSRDLKIEDAVHFIPALTCTLSALSAMDIFVMPSLQEGLGLSIMEAMLAQVPVIASSVGGIPSLVKNNETGILVKPADAEGLSRAIIDLLRDKEKALRLAHKARELVLRAFSLEAMAENTEKVYQECLAP